MVIPDPVATSFRADLKLHGREWMWDQITVDDNDFTWIATALKNGTAVAVTDGSYNRDMAPQISGTGWIIYCFQMSKQVVGNFYEVSTSASSYRGELLGLLALHVFLHAIETHFNLTSSSTHIWCDNLGALTAVKHHRKRISTGTSQADIFRALRGVRRRSKTSHQYFHVPAHQDEVIAWDCLSLQAQLNCICDTHAKAAVRRGAFAPARAGRQTLPFEVAAIFVGGVKQTSDVSSDLRFQMGRVKAREWYCQHNIFHPTVFDLVDWPILQVTMESKPQMYQLWLAKHASNFCGTGKQLQRIDARACSQCPNCEMPGKCARHLNICPDEGRTQLLHDTVDQLREWMDNRHTHPELSHCIVQYIRGRGTVSFADFDWATASMRDLGRCQDAIGWRHFMEGKVSKHILEIQTLHLLMVNTMTTPSAWIRKFLSKLLDISHSQWIYRNYTKHHRHTGTLRLQAREDVLREVNRQLDLPPGEIPEASRYLLEVDHSSSTLEDQQYWLYAMKAACTAGTRMLRRRCRAPSPHSPDIASTTPPAQRRRLANDSTAIPMPTTRPDIPRVNIAPYKRKFPD